MLVAVTFFFNAANADTLLDLELSLRRELQSEPGLRELWPREREVKLQPKSGNVKEVKGASDKAVRGIAVALALVERQKFEAKDYSRHELGLVDRVRKWAKLNYPPNYQFSFIIKISIIKCYSCLLLIIGHRHRLTA